MNEFITSASARMPVPGAPEAPPVPLGARPARHLAGIDALRAVAALSVCLFHFSSGTLPGLEVPAVRAAFAPGHLGVEMFFVISGFIIPYSLVVSRYRLADFPRYWLRRVVRIVPPAYCLLLLVVGQWVFLAHGFHNATYSRLLAELSWSQILHNVLFTVSLTPSSWMSGILWTLAVELQFYLFVGLLFRGLFVRQPWWFVLGFVAAGRLQYQPVFDHLYFFHYSSLFALGGVALLWQQRRLPAWAAVASAVLFGALAFRQLGLYAALVGVGTAGAITVLQVRVPGLSYLGRFSYSLYLVHTLVGTTAALALEQLFPPDSAAGKLGLAAVCLAVAVAGTAVFYRLVEAPFVRLARRIGR
ncbi:acyltransferase family protein [Hymenobacter convexus]|uniref:acyltransferase family protein n=1 Tax=Hymenobacter sp. CA1UV-4 TaxID=3063782 RepID=UPI002713C899|nr:acyltransferase [Hymenobacter sp. CA1UV-4]MDO7854346.1 acyltransferase [Hymenobacter sp. CA1UV-4]